MTDYDDDPDPYQHHDPDDDADYIRLKDPLVEYDL